MDSCDKAVLPRCDEGHWSYKQWSEEQMKKAVDAMIISKMSLPHAAMQYNIPKSTLGDRVSGRVQPGSVSGPTKYLTLLEENELSRFLSVVVKLGMLILSWRFLLWCNGYWIAKK